MSPQELKFDTVDVFTDTRYQGNPLAIVHLPASSSITQEQKQRIAAEFNLSETVILHENPDNAYERKVDIFVTDAEIPFAGHPTIGTLVHIGSHGPQSSSSSDTQAIALHIKAGTIRASYDRSTGVARASIPFDIYFSSLVPPTSSSLSIPNVAGYDTLPYAVVSPCKGMTFMLVEMGNEAALSALNPGMMTPLTNVYNEKVRGVVKPSLLGTYFWTVTGFDQESDTNDNTATFAIQARMMLAGIPPEDPATGSAACSVASAITTWRRRGIGNKGEAKILGPDDGEDAAKGHKAGFFDKFGQGKTGRKDRYEITQGRDMGRTSKIVVEVILNEQDQITDVVLEGQAVEVMKGILKI